MFTHSHHRAMVWFLQIQGHRPDRAMAWFPQSYELYSLN